MDSTSSFAQVRGFPQELIDVTLEFLRDDQDALKQCCLASRFFQPLCQKLILECVRLEPISEKGSENNSAVVGHSDKLTMAQRLENVIQSSPHLAPLIKELHIVDYLSARLEEDTSLPFILPLLVSLERFYFSSPLTCRSGTSIPFLPIPVQHALFTTWRSPKLTHVGIHHAVFASFTDLFSVISHSTLVRDIALCSVRVNDDVTVPVIPAPSSVVQICNINSLALSGSGLSPVPAHFYSPLLLGPKSKLSLTLLRKFYFLIGFNVQDDLFFFCRVLAASPLLEELHITMYYLPSIPEPVDVSSIRSIHLATGFPTGDGSESCPILSWWCNNLTSTPSLALKQFEIYMLISHYGSPFINRLDLVPEWKHLDEILSSEGQSK